MTTFILLSLLTYRLSRLITIDDGPADLILKFRAILGAYDYGENGQPVTSLGRGIICPHCVGLWVALGAAIGGYGLGGDTFIYWLAIAGLQSFLQSLNR